MIGPAYWELIRQAAQGDIFHNDDTKARILALMEKRREKALAAMGLPRDSEERTGIFTSGIVSLASGVRVALFFTGRKHAGENLERVLAERNAELTPPIDNNVVERALKKAILHRKNSMFFKTENGARVADLFMSLIYTAELSGTNPFDYLVELQRHSSELSENPAEWMPWNYRETLGRLAREHA
jgi:hypothetical protein